MFVALNPKGMATHPHDLDSDSKTYYRHNWQVNILRITTGSELRKCGRRNLAG